MPFFLLIICVLTYFFHILHDFHSLNPKKMECVVILRILISVFLVWFRVNKLMDSNIDLQIVKLPSFHSHPLVSRVPVNRIRRLHSRIFSIPSGLPIHPNTGVSRYIKCKKEVSVPFLESWYYSVKTWMSTFNRGLRKTVQILDIKDWLCWISGIPCPLLQLKVRMLVFSDQERKYQKSS